jgi:arylsulfatase A-like enzyme
MTRRFAMSLLVLIAVVGGGSLPAAEAPRNVVLILADDLGARDLGCFGASSFYETPRLDGLARDGLRFTAGYAACPVCSPTRASVMTGRYPQRTGVTDYIGAAQPANWKRNTRLLGAAYDERLALPEVTLAERMAAHGHATFFAGKWHLGTGDHAPNGQGFGEPLGGSGQFYYPKSDLAHPSKADDPKTTDQIAAEAARFIRAHRDRPFFAFVPFLAVHTPVQARADLVAKYEEKRKAAPAEVWGDEGERKVRLVQNHAAYGAMLEQMDTAVGRILDALTEAGVAERTVVIFTSDNGGLSTSEGHPTANVPLRAGKGWMYEGGVRTPWIVRVPGMTKPGATQGDPVMTIDLVPTVLELTGAAPAARTDGAAGGVDAVDGISLVPALSGGALRRDAALFWHYPHYGNQGGAPGGAVRSGDWKLIEWYEDGRLELYDLGRDPSETHDLSEREPERVKELHGMLAAWRTAVGARMPTPNPAFDASQPSGRR